MISLVATFAAANIKALCTAGNSCDTGLPTPAASSANLHILLQIIFGIFGAVTVLIIVIAALNFITADGDSAKVARARNTIIYALVGLVVALSAEVIVTFVLGSF